MSSRHQATPAPLTKLPTTMETRLEVALLEEVNDDLLALRCVVVEEEVVTGARNNVCLQISVRVGFTSRTLQHTWSVSIGDDVIKLARDDLLW
jgi:hypothetical protein